LDIVFFNNEPRPNLRHQFVLGDYLVFSSDEHTQNINRLGSKFDESTVVEKSALAYIEPESAKLELVLID
jgi:hypothetical protein